MKFLIVEDDIDLRETLVMIILANYNVEIIEAGDGQEAIEKLQSHGPFDLIFSDYNMPKKNGAEFYSDLRKENKSTPFVLLSADLQPFLKLYPQAPGVYTLEKPFLESTLTKKIEEILSQKNILPQQESYLPISIDILEKVVFPGVSLFIRLNQSQFIKVLKEDSQFDSTEAKRFRAKSLSHLYVELIDIKTLISNFRKNVFSKIEWELVDSEEALTSLDADWNLILDSSRNFGWSQSVTDLAKENLSKSICLMKKAPELKKTLDRLMLSNNKVQFSSHCYLLAIMTATILKELGWDSASNLQKITFAALLHDMDLTDSMFTNKVRLITEDRIEKELNQQANYKIFNHPIKAAEFVNFWTSCPADVDKLILQHHERFDGKGFPNKLNHTNIFPLSGVMIIAEDIIYQTLSENKLNPIDYLRTREEYYSQGDFKKVYSATLKVLENSYKN